MQFESAGEEFTRRRQHARWFLRQGETFKGVSGNTEWVLRVSLLLEESGYDLGFILRDDGDQGIRFEICSVTLEEVRMFAARRYVRETPVFSDCAPLTNPAPTPSRFDVVLKGRRAEHVREVLMPLLRTPLEEVSNEAEEAWSGEVVFSSLAVEHCSLFRNPCRIHNRRQTRLCRELLRFSLVFFDDVVALGTIRWFLMTVG